MMKTVCKYASILAVGLALNSAVLPASYGADGSGNDFKKAVELYGRGMYDKALDMFENLGRNGSTPDVEAYKVLCAVNLRTEGYEDMMKDFLDTYPYSTYIPQMHYQFGLNLFDDGDYKRADEELSCVHNTDLQRKQVPSFVFKKAYCNFEMHDYERAKSLFSLVNDMEMTDFTRPSQYALGYINYEEKNFADAIPWFELASKDPRFDSISKYYLLECHFMEKDYRYVLSNAPEQITQVPQERQPHIGRILSEAYLVNGDTESARKYYEEYVLRDKPQNRSDYFYAGSLLYAVEDYEGAIENYSQMEDRTDSLGQIANYQMAFSNIKTRNKVAAMEAFRDACQVNFNPDMTEDAFFNYAKLAFDLNNDSSPFMAYVNKYSDLKRGEQIYSYMAIAALNNHDYAAALDAYDKIDELDKDQLNNYIKANYMRASELVAGGSYRDAVNSLKTVSYYSDKHSRLNQLARYWLAESQYRSGDYAQARSGFTDLYNTSSLDGMEESSLLKYNVAYCLFKEEDYSAAARWFTDYLSNGNAKYAKGASERKGDCYFMQQQYKDALAAYNLVIDRFPDSNDIYPYYQAAICCGLLKDRKGKVAMLERVNGASSDSPYYSDAMYELGRAYVDMKQTDKAETCFRTLLDEAKDSTFMAKSLIELAMLSRNRKENDRAMGYYKTVVEQLPLTEQAEDALLAIESMYQSQGNPHGYFEYIESIGKGATKSEDDRQQMVFNAAEQIFLSGNYEKALASLDEYRGMYPQGKLLTKADFYTAESYRMMGQKEQAVDYYEKVMDVAGGSYSEMAKLQYADLSYSLQHFGDAYRGYESLGRTALIDANKLAAIKGMMRSAYKDRQYDNAIENALLVEKSSGKDADLKREAQSVMAKSYLATSRREKALSVFNTLSASPKTEEGAEAKYILIQDAFDRGDFSKVESLTYEFSDSGTNRLYWLAKSFIVLGDSFAENGDMAQAKATFESIKEGYTPKAGGDEILDNVNMRLDRIASMSN